jgi:hypothetical protein
MGWLGSGDSLTVTLVVNVRGAGQLQPGLADSPTRTAQRLSAGPKPGHRQGTDATTDIAKGGPLTKEPHFSPSTR